MNRFYVLPASLLVILICVVAAQAVDASMSMQQINAYGSIKPIIQELRIRKHLVVWGGWNPTTEQIQYVASHFDIVNCDPRTNPNALALLKQYNTNIKIIVYVDAVTPSGGLFSGYTFYETDYAHDDNGNRLVRKTYNFQVMNPASTHWRQVWAEVALKLCIELPIDGIFADDVWSGISSVMFIGSPPVSKAGATWYNDMKGFLSYVKNVLGDYLLIPNTSNNGEYVDMCDGKWEEGFVHARWQSYGSFLSVDNWKKKIEGVKTVCQKGKILLVSGGCDELEGDKIWVQSHPQEIEDLLRFCFCSYLLAISGDESAFNFGTYWNRDGSHGYYSIFDDAEALGNPIGNYYALNSVYVRDFENGKVLVNPTSSAFTVSLGETYKTLEGQTVSTITLDSHIGVILLNQ